MRKPIEVPTPSGTLRGWWFPAKSDEPAPAVVMLHGFSATATGMVADTYAEHFAAAGVSALLVDTLGFGLSDGTPRREINLWQQARDFISGINFLAERSDVDETRIALWGDSLSGKVALTVSAIDQRVAAVVVQVPGLGDTLSQADPEGVRFAAIQDTVLHADLPGIAGTPEGPLPVVSPDQLAMRSFLTPITAYRWFITHGAKYGTWWENQATSAVHHTPEPFDALPCMAHITAPLMMVVAHHDEMPGADADIARAAFAMAPATKELVEVDGGHFGLLYEDERPFVVSVGAQTSFLQRHLAEAQ